MEFLLVKKFYCESRGNSSNLPMYTLAYDTREAAKYRPLK